VKSFRLLVLCLPVFLTVLLLAGCAGSGRGELSGQRAEVVSAALSQVGTPYLYGGDQPSKGLDCSGLTQFAHRVAGVSIPRTAAEQRQRAQSVKTKALRPGDMVFFRSASGNHDGRWGALRPRLHLKAQDPDLSIEYALLAGSLRGWRDLPEMTRRACTGLRLAFCAPMLQNAARSREQSRGG